MPRMGMFVDIEALSEQQSNLALGMLYKAVHEHGDDDAIWEQHPNPAIRRLVELFTQRGLMRLDAFRTELVAWLAGQRHTHGGTTMPRPPGAMERWTPEQVGLVKLYLETLPPAQWTLDDHMMMVDYVAQRYLPPEDLRTEAEWLAVRSTLMGRVQANLESISASQADVVAAALPASLAQADSMFQLPQIQRFLIDFARVRAAENVRKLADDARHRMRGVIAQHVEQQTLRVPGESVSSLETKLLDEFATLNRDWRRIAVTEATEAQGQGFVASVPRGTNLKRVEHYKGACRFCISIDGKVFRVVDSGEPNKDGETQIWPGKTNIGRSAAPRKRVGQLLVEREPHELWWVASGAQHPHCRGRWLPVAAKRAGDDDDFAAWLSKTLEAKR